MLITQCKHELRQLAADRLLYALIVLFAVLIAYGLWNGERWVRFQERAIAAAHQEEATALKPQKAEEAEAGWVIGEMERDRRLQAVESEFTGQLQRQQDLAERLKFLSPALLVHSAFLDLSGTGVARHRQFLAQVDAYHAELQG